MAIVDRNGRPMSVRTDDEERQMLIDDIKRMPEHEREAMMEILEGSLLDGREGPYAQLTEAEYIRAPVNVQTFLTDPYFLGETGRSLWPKLVEDMIHLFDGTYDEAILGGSIGWGKSFFATTAIAYMLYQISCLRAPQKSYGIERGSHLYIAMLSVTEKVARRVAVNELIGKIEHSRYFKENYPIKAAPSMLEIRFPGHVNVVAGSTGSSAIIGLNVFGGLIDETSFMGETKDVDRSGKFIATDVGEKIYKSILRRMKSRFQRVGRLPGVLMVVSSKERPNAFIERRIGEARDNGDPHVFVREYATWDVKPRDFFMTKTFKVVAGDERVQSRILSGENPEEEARYREMGLQIVEVPNDYRRDFENDLDGSLRDIAGVATLSVSPYIQRTDAIFQSMDETLPIPTTVSAEGDACESWVAGSPLHLHWTLIASTFERRIPGGYVEIAWRPKRHPHAARYAHIDPSLTGDSTGLVIAHVSNWIEVIRRDPAGNEYTELAPCFETDLILRIVPPPGDEIMLSDVRSIIYQFAEHGFDIRFVSLDQFQSADTIQQMKQRGIEAEVVSMDRTTEAYDMVKAALYEGRCKLHMHRYLGAELRNLQRIPKPGGRVKIDHPKSMIGPDDVEVRGSKDIADALAGVIVSLTKRTVGQPVPPMLGISTSGDQEKPDHSWVVGGSTMIGQEEGGSAKRQGPGMVSNPSPPGRGRLPFMKG